MHDLLTKAFHGLTSAPLVMLGLSLLASLALHAQAGAQPVELTPARTFILVADKAGNVERNAAVLLSMWLQKATRSTAGFEVRTETAGKDLLQDPANTVIVVGSTTRWATPDILSQLQHDGFFIGKRDGVIVVTGSTPDGTRLGVTHFLSLTAGVRFYMPGELWASLPVNPQITFPGEDVLSNPFVTSAYMSGINIDDRDGAHWARTVGAWRRKGGTHQHNLFEMFPPEQWAASNPEIYPIYEGQRYIPKTGRDQSWQICFSQPQTLVAAREAIRKHFEKWPDYLYATISNNDGGRWCTCEKCSAILAQHQEKNPQGNATLDATTQMYWSFMAKVAQQMMIDHPGKLLVGLAYGPTRQPPDFKLPDNVVAFTNFHIAELPVDGILEGNNGQPALLDQWLAVVNHMGNHDWYQGSGYMIPRFYSGYWSAFMRALDSKLGDAFQHCETYPNWYLDGPKFYVLTRLWWDTQADPDAITRQFCDDMFGQAGSSMNTYYQLAEKLWTQLNIIDGPERKLHNWATQFRTTPASRAIIRQMSDALSQATAQAVTDQEKQRIALITRSWKFSEALFAMGEHDASSPQGMEAWATAQALAEPLKDDRMAVMHGQQPAAAVADLRWARVRAEAKSITLPRIDPVDLQNDNAWAGASAQNEFILRGVGKDTGNTQLLIAQDGQFIYLQVTCPRDMSTIIETQDDTWRSDNIEIFIDTDGQPDVMERQFWVKTTGRVVNHTKNAPAVDQIKAVVKKEPGQLVFRIALPLAYADVTLPLKKPMTLQVIRNEFVVVKGVNELKTAAVWNRQVAFGE